MAPPPIRDREVNPGRSPEQRMLRDRILKCVREALRATLAWFPDQTGNRLVIVGFSGGGDSTVLLRLLETATGPGSDADETQLLAAHLDHRLRPDSGEQARFARAVATSLAIEFVGAQRDVGARARREGRSLEEAGRLERLDFFAEVVRKRGPAAVLLGHTLTDQAETLLLRLTRGAGGLGLGAMAPIRGDERGLVIARPLLSVSRADISALVEQEGWPVYRDPSNADEGFARNRIRNRTLPLLEASNPQAEAALGRTAALLRDDEEWLSELTSRRFAEIATVGRAGNATEVRFPAAALASARPALGRRLVREGLRVVRGHLRRIGLVHIEAVLRAAQGGRGGSSLDLPGAVIRLERGILAIAPGGTKNPRPEASGPGDVESAASRRGPPPGGAPTEASGRTL